ncbi:Uncharacterised protein [Klebsiella pneumoniae]|uniref:Uncharacterized protein n=1 Tax=Klebsiella pneumoniae TaxID=573 RepID=A0A378AJ94_KLEPN|nr:Uncharacterised protein [Klebsiella pneumoniae]
MISSFGFAQTYHQAGFRRDLRVRFFKTLQQLQRPVVIRARTYLTIKTGHVFEVMVEDIRRGHRQNIKCAIHAAAEIRNQRFDLNRRVFLANGADAVGKMLCAAITQVVTVYRGDYDIAQTHIGDSLRQLLWLVCIWRDRASMRDVAERATAGTDRAEDHKGRGTVVEAFCRFGQEASSHTECRPFLRIAALIPWIRDESAGSLIFIHSGFLSRASRSVATFFTGIRAILSASRYLTPAFHHNGFTHSVRVPVASHEESELIQ